MKARNVTVMTTRLGSQPGDIVRIRGKYIYGAMDVMYLGSEWHPGSTGDGFPVTVKPQEIHTFIDLVMSGVPWQTTHRILDENISVVQLVSRISDAVG